MIIITARQGRNYGRATYVAVPAKPSLIEVVNRSHDLKNEVFPMGNSSRNIDAVKALLSSDGVFSEVTMTFSNTPLFDPRIYDLPSRSLDGFTTFHVSSVSQNEQKSLGIVDKVLGLFPEVIDLKMKPDIQAAMQRAFPRLIRDFGEYLQFFERYNYMKERLSRLQEQPYKQVQRGFFVDAFRYVLSKKGIHNFPDSYAVELIKRVNGRIRDMPVELVVLYINGPSLNPRLYGVAVYTQYEQGCPVWETNECDQARSFAGYIFHPNQFFYGGVKLMPEKAAVMGGDMPGLGGRRDFCLRPIGMRQASDGWKIIEKDISAFDRFVTKEHIVEMRELAKWAYDNSNR